ncbi:peroxidase 4, partial [Tanacetum coccineum]
VEVRVGSETATPNITEQVYFSFVTFVLEGNVDKNSNCPRASGSGDNNLAPLDVQTPNAFNNDYYKNLIAKKGLLHSDQQLFNGGSADSTVRQYSSNPSQFSSDFAAAMIKMGDFRPLTGSSGEIRRNCRRPN